MLLLLGPTTNGVPGLIGVATLPLHIEEVQTDLSHSWSSRAQPLPLISPAGERIGCITAAARVVCCQPAPPEQLKSQPSQDSSVSSTTARVSSYRSATPAALQEPVHHALVATMCLPAEPPAALLPVVSAAVQTDAPQDMSSASPQPRQEVVQQPLQAAQEVVQQEAGAAASSEGVNKHVQASQPPDFPPDVQSLHFHIYPPGLPTVRAAPPKQPAMQRPPVINISQPIFNFAAPKEEPPQAEHLPKTMSQSGAVLAPVTDNTAQRLQQLQPGVAGNVVQKLQPAVVKDTTAVAHDTQQTLQAAVEQLAAPGETRQAVQMVKAVDDFESWRPAMSVPLSNGTAVAADRHGLAIDETAAEEAAESGMAGQCCSGAHALTFRHPKPCNHQVLCCCHTRAMHTVPNCLCPWKKHTRPCAEAGLILIACSHADASWRRLL